MNKKHILTFGPNNRNFQQASQLAKEYQALGAKIDRLGKKYYANVAVIVKRQNEILAQMRIKLNVKEEVYPEMYR